MNLLVVSEEPGQSEGLSTRVADVLFALRVDTHVVT